MRMKMIKLDDYLKSVKSIAVTGHVRPDGDCIGSSLGFLNYAKDNFPEVKVDLYLEKPGNEFSYLRCFDCVKTEIIDKSAHYDLLIVFDCGDENRFEPFKALLDMVDDTLCIDHHMANTGFARTSVVIEDLSSTCELLYECLDCAKISKATAECLYTGIICDTGIFRYQAATKRTMEVAGALMDKGIDHTKIIDEGFYMKTYHQNQIIGRALLESVVFYDGKCIYSAINRETMEFYGLKPGEMGGVIDQLRNTEGIEVAIFLYEVSEEEYKVSMRSKEYIDVSAVCRFFGGGGHVRAAGCNMQGTVHDIINNLGAQLELQFNLNKC
jgi:phosphoesterase RecJ-like protein